MIVRQQEDDLRRRTSKYNQLTVGLTRSVPIYDLRPSLILAVHPVLQKPGQSRQFPFLKIGIRFLHVPGRLNASTGLPLPPATCPCTSRTRSWNVMDIASSSSWGQLAGISRIRSTTPLNRRNGIKFCNHSSLQVCLRSRSQLCPITSSWILPGKLSMIWATTDLVTMCQPIPTGYLCTDTDHHSVAATIELRSLHLRIMNFLCIWRF